MSKSPVIISNEKYGIVETQAFCRNDLKWTTYSEPVDILNTKTINITKCYDQPNRTRLEEKAALIKLKSLYISQQPQQT